MPGDIVRVLDDIARVHELQKDQPGWLDDMALVCSFVLTVVGTLIASCITRCVPLLYLPSLWVWWVE